MPEQITRKCTSEPSRYGWHRDAHAWWYWYSPTHSIISDSFNHFIRSIRTHSHGSDIRRKGGRSLDMVDHLAGHRGDRTSPYSHEQCHPSKPERSQPHENKCVSKALFESITVAYFQNLVVPFSWNAMTPSKLPMTFSHQIIRHRCSFISERKNSNELGRPPDSIYARILNISYTFLNTACQIHFTEHCRQKTISNGIQQKTCIVSFQIFVAKKMHTEPLACTSFVRINFMLHSLTACSTALTWMIIGSNHHVFRILCNQAFAHVFCETITSGMVQRRLLQRVMQCAENHLELLVPCKPWWWTQQSMLQLLGPDSGVHTTQIHLMFLVSRKSHDNTLLEVANNISERAIRCPLKRISWTDGKVPITILRHDESTSLTYIVTI